MTNVKLFERAHAVRVNRPQRRQRAHLVEKTRRGCGEDFSRPRIGASSDLEIGSIAAAEHRKIAAPGRATSECEGLEWNGGRQRTD